MSGPKRSSWLFLDPARENLRRQREANRNSQIATIRTNLNTIQIRLQKLAEKDAKYAATVSERISLWQKEVETNLRGDLRLAFRSLKGIKNYLNQQEARLEDLLKRREQEIAEAAEKRRIEAALAMHFDYFDSIQELYPELMNEGIRQRLKIFSAALSQNIENTQTIQQINAFKAQFAKIVEEHEAKQEQYQYLKKVLESAIGATADEDTGGDASIAGKINGVPIQVHIEAKSNQIRFDTPEDGSCKQAMQTLVKTLDENGIKLGPIQILKTGEHLNRGSTYQDARHRIKQ